MSEMVERVARALCKHNGFAEDVIVPPNQGVGHKFFGDSQEHPQWEFFKGDASEAIGAMREPTEAMIAASVAPLRTRHLVNLTDPPKPRADASYPGAWRRMIDEALR